MIEVPDMKSETLAHIVRFFANLDFLNNSDIEELAQTLEGKRLSYEPKTNEHLAVLAKIVREYKEVA